MKTKLIKTYSSYYLYVDGNIIASNEEVDGKQKLSLKNCQAIERGYDLDELLNDYIMRRPFMRIDKKHQKMYKEGFQKALEILGDKKLSREKVQDNFKGLRDCISDKDIAEFYIQLAITMFSEIQQTEWDVEVLMEKVQVKLYIKPEKEAEYKSKPIELQHPYTTNPDEIWEYKPKFDLEGCLILKRI